MLNHIWSLLVSADSAFAWCVEKGGIPGAVATSAAIGIIMFCATVSFCDYCDRKAAEQQSAKV